MTRILLVDDDRDILEIVRLDLQDNPAFTVDICTSSPEALETAQRNSYDVIIADWRMPRMNGTDLIKNLRLGGCTSYIIIYSGCSLGPDIRAALDFGADYYLHRDGDPDREFAELHRVIDKVTRQIPVGNP
jgi:DNA-binding response OmpR family regulator